MSAAATSNTRHADIIVIGAGVLGTFHAYFAAKKGYKVLLLERNAFPTDASTRNFGMGVQTIVEAEGEWAGFARASRAIYRALQKELDLGVRVTGSLYLASTELEPQVLAEFAQQHASTFHCTYLEAGEALARYPFVKASYCAGALYFSDDLSLEPRRMLRQLLPFMVEKGTFEYQPNTTIISVAPSGQSCVVKDAAGHTYTAGQVFVCSGAEYRILLPEFFQASGMHLCKLQMMRTVPQPERILPHNILSGLSILRYPAFKSTPSYALLQEQPVEVPLKEYGIHLLFKQGIDGSVIIGDSHEYRPFVEAHQEEEATTPAINEAILRYGRRMINLPTWELQALWNGYYLLHPERPVYTATLDGVIHVVTGIAGKGMSTGPGFAQANIAAALG